MMEARPTSAWFSHNSPTMREGTQGTSVTSASFSSPSMSGGRPGTSRRRCGALGHAQA
jgi:hypothetical protein